MDSKLNLPFGIEQVVNLLGIKVIQNTGSQLHCRCPFCDDKKSHLNVRLSSNVFRCNRCGKGGGMLHLYANMHDLSLNRAYDELCQLYHSGSKDLHAKDEGTVKQNITRELPLASSEVRNNTYSNLLSMLSLGATHRQSLLSRGLSGEDVVQLEYRTTPAVRAPKLVTELLERGCTLYGVPGFYCDEETGRWKLDIRGSGIMLPDRNSNGEIEAIQIRLDKAHRAKFNNLTSVDRNCGVTAACCPHFVGITDSTQAVYLTEGIMKADIAHYLSEELGHPRAFIGLTGVGNRRQFQRALDELHALGIRKIMVAFDMDAAVNENVRKAKERVISMGLKEGFEMTPLYWDARYKGIDDLLASVKERKLQLQEYLG